MAYTKRGPWVDDDMGAFDSDDLSAMDEAIARLGGGGVVDLGSIVGPVSIDMDAGGVFRGTMTGDAAFTFANASLPSRRRAARLMLSTQGYVPTFPGSTIPAGGLIGDYVGAVDQFDVETAPGHSTPMIQHVAGYGRYRAAFVGIAGTHVQTSFDGHTWQGTVAAAGTSDIQYNTMVWSPTARVFVWLVTLARPPFQYGIATSRDGVNWTRQAFTYTSNSSPSSLVFNRHTGMLNVFTGDGLIMYESFDGRAWATKTLTGLDRAIMELDWSPVLGLYAAADFGSYRLTSTDQLAWTKSTGNTDQATTMRWVDAWGLFVAAGNTFVNTSTDNATWIRRFTRTAGDYSMSGIAFSDTAALMTVSATIPDVSNASYISPDSVTWGYIEPPYELRNAPAFPTWSRGLQMWMLNYTQGQTSSPMYQTSRDAITWDAPASFAAGFTAPIRIISGD